MNFFLHLACGANLLMQTGIALALPPCPETGYFHNCFGTRTYAVAKKNNDEAFAALEREIEQARKVTNSDDISKSTPVVQKPNKYVGEFKDDKRDGFGVFTGNGIEYEGSWKNDKKNGRGFYTANEKSLVFVGEFKDDKRSGPGQLLLSNGDIYVGEFNDDVSITFRVKAFNYIVEEWVDRGINGQGVMTYADDRVGLGEWKDGNPHGLFIEYGSDRKIFNSGIYKRGQIRDTQNINPEVFTLLNVLHPCQGDVKKWSNCIGEIANSNEAEQSTYYGQFLDGNYSGRGKFVYETKGVSPVFGVYRGEFKNGQFHGLGVHKFQDGKVQIGEWHEGKPIRLFLNLTADQAGETTIFRISR